MSTAEKVALVGLGVIGAMTGVGWALLFTEGVFSLGAVAGGAAVGASAFIGAALGSE